MQNYVYGIGLVVCILIKKNKSIYNFPIESFKKKLTHLVICKIHYR